MQHLATELLGDRLNNDSCLFFRFPIGLAYTILPVRLKVVWSFVNKNASYESPCGNRLRWGLQETQSELETGCRRFTGEYCPRRSQGGGVGWWQKFNYDAVIRGKNKPQLIPQ